MKKNIFGTLLFLALLLIIKMMANAAMSPKSITDRIGNKLVEQMKSKNYRLYGHGWVGWQSKDRVSFFLQCANEFDPQIHFSDFLESFEELLQLLNDNKSALQINDGVFDQTNVDFAISWPDSNSLLETCPKAMIGTKWSDDIMVVYFLPGGIEVTKNVPYETFKTLVEEKRFDEILHYGE